MYTDRHREFNAFTPTKLHAASHKVLRQDMEYVSSNLPPERYNGAVVVVY